jgi:uncharacterized protein
MIRQHRLDIRSGLKFKKSSQGGLVSECRPTRVGILTYRNDDGSVRKEFRPPEEVFHPESLASLAGAPVTYLHPDRMIGPDNYREHSRGHIGDDVRADGDFVGAKAYVQDGAAVQDILDDKISEMSAGYDADVYDEPGTYRGEKYDAIQRNIRYNHVALGPKDWGRAGNKVGLRMDAADPNVAYSLEDGSYSEGMTVKVEENKVTFDAKDFVPRSEFEKLQGENEALKTELAASKKAHTDAEDRVSPKSLDALMHNRFALVEGAREVGGKDLKFDGLSDHEIRCLAVVKASPEMKLDGKSSDFVLGVFERLVTERKGENKAHEDAQDVTGGKKTVETGEHKDAAGERRAQMIKDNAAAFGKTGSK